MTGKSEKKSSFFSYLAYLPYLLIAIYLVVIWYIILNLPSPQVLMQTIEAFFRSYGYPLVLISAILEATFLLGLYVPGSSVILFGAALAKTGAISFPIVLFLGTLGLVTGYVINYFLGVHGWYHVLSKFGLDKGIHDAEEKLQRHGVKAIFIGYFFPNGGAFLSTAAGILKMPFGKFLLISIIAQTFWSVVWGSIAYTFGMLLVEPFIEYSRFILPTLAIIWLLRNYVFAKKEKK